MHISKNGLDLIKKYEGFYSKAYLCPAGVLTIGYGTTNADSKILNYTITKTSTITEDKATEFLKKSIEKKYEPCVNKYLEKYKLNQNQYDALVSFAYNIGSIDQLTNNGKKSIKDISNDMLLYDHAKGVRLKGLTRRREEEHKLFNTPISKISPLKKETGKTTRYIVTADYLNVRKGPGVNYDVTNVLKKGDAVNIVDVKNGWGELANTTRWIFLSYCKKTNTISSKANKTTAYKVISAGLNVRCGCGTKYKVVNCLSKGDKIYIDKKNNSWGRIANTNNWINLNYTQKIN